MSVKINSLEIENTKRIKAVALEPSASGLTVIGGRNNQGKTSVLDSIAWALGGSKYKPSQAEREGSMVPPHLKVTLSNGFIVERKGKNGALKVTDPSGQKAGQKILDDFIEELALNLPKFMESSAGDKAKILLQIIGVGPKLAELEQAEQAKYDERTMVGRIYEQKRKYAAELPYYEDAPDEMISIQELLQQQQAILAQNGENARKRQNVASLQSQYDLTSDRVSQLQAELEKALAERERLADDLAIATQDAADLHDEGTEELEANIANIEQINLKVRTNNDKTKAEEDAALEKSKKDALTAEIEDIRKAKADLLNGADLPLDGLTVEQGELLYLGQRWDNMSGSQQLRVATAIVRKLKPECGFVLIDKLEQMDEQTLQEFGQWLEAEGLQAIATRVSTGGECSIIIEDGYSVEPAPTQAPTWQGGF